VRESERVRATQARWALYRDHVWTDPTQLAGGLLRNSDDFSSNRCRLDGRERLTSTLISGKTDG